MFTEQSHSNHGSKWMIPSPSCRNTDTCVACLLDVLNNTSLSQVQRQMSLDILKSLFKESDVTLHLFAANQNMSYQVVDLVTDFYTDEPHRHTAISLCVSMVHRLQDETVYEVLIGKFQNEVLNMHNEKRIQFFLLVFDQLCDVSMMYSEILLSSQTDTISQLLSAQEFMEVETSSALVCLLTHMMKALASSPVQFLASTDSFLWKVLVVLVYWLNTAANNSFQVHCLALLKECLQLEEVTPGLMLAGYNNQEGHSLLMGLKRILVTKDEVLVYNGTQCLTRIMENLAGTEHIKEVFNTDLAEFVFELLHSSDVSKLDCVFQCLRTMASHRLFFDKCHAVYGLDSTLLAVQEALDNGRCVIVEIGLSFLTCLMEGQPECMPMFVSRSWSNCCQLLHACLQHRKLSLFVNTLKATHSFLRPQHHQSPVDVTSMSSLLRAASAQCQHYLKVQSEQDMDQQSFTIVCTILDTTLACYELIVGDDVLCGNMDEQIQVLNSVVRDVCGKLILPWMLEHWDYLSDSSRIEKFLACLDVHMSADMLDQQARIVHVVASGLPCRILCLNLQSHISDECRILMGHVLAGLFLQLAKYQRPSLELNEETLIAGFSRLNWQEAHPGRRDADKINSREEVVAWFCLTYFSCLVGYRTWRLMDIHNCLERILEKHPELLSYEMVVARAFVYLQAICQTTGVEDDGLWCHETECCLMTYLRKSPVEVWYTEDTVVFRWSVLTETRASSVGIMLVEHWLLDLAASSRLCGLVVALLAEDKQEILLEMRHNYNFLHCLVVLLSSQAVMGLCRDVLMYCISSLSNDATESHHVTLCENLYREVTHKFQVMFLQTADINALLLVNMLPVLCELMESSLMSTAKQASCLKCIYHAVKLAGMPAVRNSSSLAWALRYLSCVTSSMSGHDSRTVIPALGKDVIFMETLESSMRSCESSLSAPALCLCAWLASTQQQCQTSRPVVVTSDFLLSSLASSKYASSLPVLKLLDAALSMKSHAAPALGRCVQFVKRQLNFVSTRVFSSRELRQVYLYLQQFVVKEDASLRSQAAECMKTLFNTHPEICSHTYLQPWNSLMLESVLTARTHSGLKDPELNLCLLFLPSPERMWMGNAANSFMLALLKSDLNTDQLDKATCIFKQIKQFPDILDEEVLVTATEYLTSHTTRSN